MKKFERVGSRTSTDFTLVQTLLVFSWLWNKNLHRTGEVFEKCERQRERNGEKLNDVVEYQKMNLIWFEMDANDFRIEFCGIVTLVKRQNLVHKSHRVQCDYNTNHGTGTKSLKKEQEHSNLTIWKVLVRKQWEKGRKSRKSLSFTISVEKYKENSSLSSLLWFGNRKMFALTNLFEVFLLF